jgi:hypothetical protein
LAERNPTWEIREAANEALLDSKKKLTPSDREWLRRLSTCKTIEGMQEILSSHAGLSYIRKLAGSPVDAMQGIDRLRMLLGTWHTAGCGFIDANPIYDLGGQPLPQQAWLERLGLSEASLTASYVIFYPQPFYEATPHPGENSPEMAAWKTICGDAQLMQITTQRYLDELAKAQPKSDEASAMLETFRGFVVRQHARQQMHPSLPICFQVLSDVADAVDLSPESEAFRFFNGVGNPALQEVSYYCSPQRRFTQLARKVWRSMKPRSTVVEVKEKFFRQMNAQFYGEYRGWKEACSPFFEALKEDIDALARLHDGNLKNFKGAVIKLIQALPRLSLPPRDIPTTDPGVLEFRQIRRDAWQAVIQALPEIANSGS